MVLVVLWPLHYNNNTAKKGKFLTGTYNEYDLSILIPFYNAEIHLERVVSDFYSLEQRGARCQIILCDDNSTDRGEMVARELTGRYPSLVLIRNEEGRGAGRARNAAWPHARGRYSMFFDADDIVHGSVVQDVIQHMDKRPEVNLAVCAYRYQREEASSFTEMSYNDSEIMRKILSGRSLEVARTSKVAQLLTFSNYPWNKVLRTAHYRKVGVRFGSAKVNNDILGHWHSVLLARRIIVLNSVICTHVVHPGGDNLTNILGADRLALFDSLNEVYDFLESRPLLRRQYSLYFWQLADWLKTWERGRLGPGLASEVDVRYANLLARIDLSDLLRMRRKQAPGIANKIVNGLI